MPCTIVRLAGCPLRCKYCDTRQALSFSSGSTISIANILTAVNLRNMPLTLVTGGEPLAQKQSLQLLEGLAKSRPVVQLETSGSISIQNTHPSVRRIMDIKTPGSGEQGRNLWENIKHLRSGDEVKFVLTDRVDYDWAMHIIRQYRLAGRGLPILFSPAWEQLDAQKLVRWIVQDRAPVRMHLQIHKAIWDPKATGV